MERNVHYSLPLGNCFSASCGQGISDNPLDQTFILFISEQMKPNSHMNCFLIHFKDLIRLTGVKVKISACSKDAWQLGNKCSHPCVNWVIEASWQIEHWLDSEDATALKVIVLAEMMRKHEMEGSSNALSQSTECQCSLNDQLWHFLPKHTCMRVVNMRRPTVC